MKTTLHQQQPPSTFLTQEELRERWKVSLMSLWRMRRDGKLPAYKIGARGVRFALVDIVRIEQEAAA
jgi:predicted DNA-binding transcriptional regulator AlpA